MGFSDKDAPTKIRTKGLSKRLGQFLLHAPVAACGLVALAILSSVLVYAQAGLLVRRPAPPESPGQAMERDQPPQPAESPARTKQLVLDTQSSIPQEAPAPTSKAITACDEKARTLAKQVHEQAIRAEEKLHQKHLSGTSRISKLLSSLGLAKDKTAAENTRHKKSIGTVNSIYRQALAAANCKS